MKQIFLTVYVSRFPYYIIGVDEDENVYSFINNVAWIKTNNEIPFIKDDHILIDKDVFYVQD